VSTAMRLGSAADVFSRKHFWIPICMQSCCAPVQQDCAYLHSVSFEHTYSIGRSHSLRGRRMSALGSWAGFPQEMTNDEVSACHRGICQPSCFDQSSDQPSCLYQPRYSPELVQICGNVSSSRDCFRMII
jgi:hypothetical protein